MSVLHFRLAHYAVTLCLYLYTFYDIVARLEVTTRDPVVADYARLQARFLTIWTFMVQIAYMSLGLTTDLVTLRAAEPNQLVKRLKGVRRVVFSSVVWPATWTVTLMFWPLYLYDPALVFPPFVDKILSPFNNQVLHSYIGSAAVFELLCLGRIEPNHKKNFRILIAYMMLYLLVFTASYLERGTWLYPIFDKLMGTVYFPVMFVSPLVVALAVYYLQFYIADFFWPTQKRTDKKKQ